MLRILSAASGEEVATLAVSELAEDGAPTVFSLKHYLAKGHFQKRYSRFQLKLLREGDPGELREDEIIAPPLELQLVLMNHLASDPVRDTKFLTSCMEGNLEEVERNLQELQNPNVVDEPWGDFPLLCAASNGHTQMVRLLLEAGADTERRNEENDATAATVDDAPLLHSVLAGHLEVVRVLLEYRAETNVRNSDWRSPLHHAASKGHLVIAQLLLESGANKEAKDVNGHTPLHYAACQNHMDAVRLLLEVCVQTEAIDCRGRQPLHTAALSGRLEIVSLLLDHGAEQDALDSFGQTPAQLAASNGHRTVAELLNRGTCKRRRQETSAMST